MKYLSNAKCYTHCAKFKCLICYCNALAFLNYQKNRFH